ncbi:MAG: ATP-dependent Clp protease adaptor ClpS [Ignavibacteria bacterium]|nr:ATP-dependent Clp protease adaptor ClpS [Bacteroidota bacterium]MSQ45506.1 ATP-dependent Clp protease adaptor ClpS [Ignavibacteria bacterium]
MTINLQSTGDPEVIEQVIPDTSKEISVGKPARAILFNDEIHSFDEVINQIIKAIKCNRNKAESLTWEVHNLGKSCVFTGELIKCLQITAVLEEIQLMTEVQI